MGKYKNNLPGVYVPTAHGVPAVIFSFGQDDPTGQATEVVAPESATNRPAEATTHAS